MLPLHGIKVVEIAQNLSGPYAGEILATLGADVLKVERPGGGDARGWGPPLIAGSATAFQTVNCNKRSITLDLRQYGGCSCLRALVTDVDVLRAADPQPVHCSLWAFGAVGPMRLDPGYEPMVQAFSGLFGLNGCADGPPSRVGVQLLDLGTGLWAALLRRGTTGEGAVVDASLLETALGWMSVPFAAFAATGTGTVPPRHRTGNPKLAGVLGRAEWVADPRYASNASRVAHRDVLIADIGALMATRPSSHWAPLFASAGVPFAPINDIFSLMADPQVAALGILQDMPGLDLTTVGLPLSFDGLRPAMRTPAPGLEQADVLA